MMRCVLAGLAGLAMLLCLGCGGDEEPAGGGGGGGGGTPLAQGDTAGASTLAPEAQRLVGVWKGKEPLEEGVKVEGEEAMEVSVEFKDDGTVNMDMMFEMSGKWKLVKAEGDNYIVNTALEMPSFDMSMETDEGGKVKEEAKVETETQEMEFTIVFETDDRIKMAPSDEPEQALTLDRQK